MAKKSQLKKLAKYDGLILPESMKGKTRADTIRYATLFALKVCDDYLQSSNKTDINGYVKFLDEICWGKLNEIRNKSNDGKWEIHFGQDDKYSLEGGKAVLAQNEAIEKLTSINQYIKSLIRLFWDHHGSETQNLKWFVDWIPKYTAKL